MENTITLTITITLDSLYSQKEMKELTPQLLEEVTGIIKEGPMAEEFGIHDVTGNVEVVTYHDPLG